MSILEERRVLDIKAMSELLKGDRVTLSDGCVVCIEKTQPLYDHLKTPLVVDGLTDSLNEVHSFKVKDMLSVTRNGKNVAQAHEEVEKITFGSLYKALKDDLVDGGLWTDVIETESVSPENRNMCIRSADMQLLWDVSPTEKGYCLTMKVCDYERDYEFAELTTCCATENGYRKLVMLGAEFTIALRKWISHNADLLCRKGYCLAFFDAGTNALAYRILYSFKVTSDSAIEWAADTYKYQTAHGNDSVTASLFRLDTIEAIRQFFPENGGTEETLPMAV